MNNNLESEIWKDITGYEGLYQASNLGRIKSLDRMRKNRWNTFYIIKGDYKKIWLNSSGHLTANLNKYGERSGFLVHRLIALTFIPNLENKPEINHKNLIKIDNRIENLEWVYNHENVAHYHANCKENLSLKGEACSFSKLNDKKIREIRKMRLNNVLPNTKIAIKYGVSAGIIDHIIQGKTWRHVK